MSNQILPASHFSLNNSSLSIVCNIPSYANSDNHIILMMSMSKSRATCTDLNDFDKFEFEESDDLHEFFED